MALERKEKTLLVRLPLPAACGSPSSSSSPSASSSCFAFLPKLNRGLRLRCGGEGGGDGGRGKRGESGLWVREGSPVGQGSSFESGVLTWGRSPARTWTPLR